MLRFTNPTRGNAGGAIFLWLLDERPVAAASLRIRPDGAFWREFTSLSDQPLNCTRDGKVVWSPKSGITRQPVPDAPKPAATPATRLVQMRRIAEKVVADYPVRALAALHRVGSLKVGDLAVVVAVSCPHRGEAFEACRRLIDDLKHEVPIWKHQKFSDGTEEWVGAC